MSLYDDDDDIVKEKESQVAGWSQVNIGNRKNYYFRTGENKNLEQLL